MFCRILIATISDKIPQNWKGVHFSKSVWWKSPPCDITNGACDLSRGGDSTPT